MLSAMTISVIHVYKDVLPKTNCGDCGVPTCLAFASKVVLEKAPLGGCPHADPDAVTAMQAALTAQQDRGEGLVRDMAADALRWAQERLTSMRLEDLPDRVEGSLETLDGAPVVRLDYFDGAVLVRGEPLEGDAGAHQVGAVEDSRGSALNRWEQVLLLNHLAQGGSRPPTGAWIGLEQVPGSTSKVVSLRDEVERPLARAFGGRLAALRQAAKTLGGEERAGQFEAADLALVFRPLPRVPVAVLFWDTDEEEGFEARAKLLWDETVNEHLDLESIVFLGEQLKDKLEGRAAHTTP